VDHKLIIRKLVFGLLLAASIAFLAWSFWHESQPAQNSRPDGHALNVSNARYAYGFNMDSFELDRFELKPNEVLGDILSARGVSYSSIDALASEAEETFSVRHLRPGKPCAIVRRKGSGSVDCFIYEPNAYQYVLFNVLGTPDVEIYRHDIEKCIETSGGTITSSLWLTMANLGHPVDLIARMEDALAWSVSFYHVQRGDAYRLIYENDYIDGVPVGVGKLLGASFETGGKETFSIYFDSENYEGYYDEEGRPMKRAFLKAPVRYSRISSRYSLRRFHPVQKRYKGHFGTDYAADYGTPIMAVADGKITKASYTKGNGNYVKIKHDGTYETQYLHMSKFAPGIKPGALIKQGDTIGYVGATGLATGPHVCFRFWKNGRQVDHLRENLPPPDPMPEDNMPEFESVRDAIIPQLEMIPVHAASTSKP
jgi:murein DD-endopeptidase MepM/ murein hydrolase activator NlpD